jgi:hypothetical protein
VWRDAHSRAWLFWDGQSDESAHVLVPRLESVLRETARRAGLTIIREPIAAKPVGVRSLGTLLLELQGALPDPPWPEYFFNLLADPLGLKLRNHRRAWPGHARRRRGAAATRRMPPPALRRGSANAGPSADAYALKR